MRTSHDNRKAALHSISYLHTLSAFYTTKIQTLYLKASILLEKHCSLICHHIYIAVLTSYLNNFNHLASFSFHDTVILFYIFSFPPSKRHNFFIFPSTQPYRDQFFCVGQAVSFYWHHYGMHVMYVNSGIVFFYFYSVRLPAAIATHVIPLRCCGPYWPWHLRV